MPAPIETLAATGGEIDQNAMVRRFGFVMMMDIDDDPVRRVRWTRRPSAGRDTCGRVWFDPGHKPRRTSWRHRLDHFHASDPNAHPCQDSPSPPAGSGACHRDGGLPVRFHRHAAAEIVLGFAEFGDIYSRIMEPNNSAVLKQRIASAARSPGRAAENHALQTSRGRSLHSMTSLYGGTWNIFLHTFKRLGITVRSSEPTEPWSSPTPGADPRQGVVEAVGSPRPEHPQRLRAC